jgi:hypothetical protein
MKQVQLDIFNSLDKFEKHRVNDLYPQFTLNYTNALHSKRKKEKGRASGSSRYSRNPKIKPRIIKSALEESKWEIKTESEWEKISGKLFRKAVRFLRYIGDGEE